MEEYAKHHLQCAYPTVVSNQPPCIFIHFCSLPQAYAHPPIHAAHLDSLAIVDYAKRRHLCAWPVTSRVIYLTQGRAAVFAVGVLALMGGIYPCVARLLTPGNLKWRRD
jgi:hypothetical protein